jgi:hypothetical protein
MRDVRGRLHLFEQRAEVVVVHAGAALAVDHAAFAFHDLRIEREVRHAVGLELEHDVERILREPVLVDGHVARGIGVVGAAIGFHDAIELSRRARRGAIEHHVLEVVCDAGDAGVLVASSRPEPGVERDVRDVAVGPDHDLQAVVEGAGDDRIGAGHGRRRGVGRGRDGRRQGQQQQARAEAVEGTGRHARLRRGKAGL